MKTFTLTTSQEETLEMLRMTTITGADQKDGMEKTLEQIVYQALERGIASIQQTRKQYIRTKAALKAYAGR